MAHRNSWIVFVAFLYGTAWCADTAVKTDTGNTANVFTTVKEGKFVFSYKTEGNNLVAEVSYPTMGWVAVGFNPVKMMKGANFIIGALVDGKTVISDEFGVTPYSHKPDTALGGKYSIVRGACTSKDGILTMAFTIPLNSGDDKDVVLEKGKAIRVIFASGKKNDIRSMHSSLGKTDITLKN